MQGEPVTKTLTLELDLSHHEGMSVDVAGRWGSSTPKQVVLHDEWAETVVAEGDLVVLLGSFTDPGTSVCSNGFGGRREEGWQGKGEGDFGAQRDQGVWHLRRGGAGLLVVHPHVLISASRLGVMTQCARKAMMLELVKDGDMQASAIIGNMIHAVFQNALETDDYREETLLAAMDQQVAENAGELVGAGVSTEDALAQLQAYLENLVTFFDTFRAPRRQVGQEALGGSRVASPVRAEAALVARREERRQRRGGEGAGGVVWFGGEEVSVKLVRPAVDIEEMVCSSRYGLQGRLDATVEVEIQDKCSRGGKRARDGGGARRVLLPLELKSGKSCSRPDHEVQVTLYSLLMPERYVKAHVPTMAGSGGHTGCAHTETKTMSAEVGAGNGGLLLYIKELALRGVSMRAAGVATLLQYRNRLAAAQVRLVTRMYACTRARVPVCVSFSVPYSCMHACTRAQVRQGLLPMLGRPSECERCFTQPVCALYHRAVEQGSAESAGMGDAFETATSHLTASQCEYFRKWHEMISLEEGVQLKAKRTHACMTSTDCERLGKGCAARMRVRTVAYGRASGAMGQAEKERVAASNGTSDAGGGAGGAERDGGGC